MNASIGIIEQVRIWGAQCKAEGIESANKDPFMISLLKDRRIGQKKKGQPSVETILQAWKQGWESASKK